MPLWADKAKGIVNMVVEIPKGQNAKMEISKADSFNPIKQDVKVHPVSIPVLIIIEWQVTLR